MKLIKRIFRTTLVALFCFSTITAAHAAIIWDAFFFRYAVDANEAEVYKAPATNPEVLTGPTPENTNQGGEDDPVDSRVDSSLSPPDPTGLGLQLNAGAGGQLLLNGVRIESYAETSTISGGVLAPYSVGLPANQSVFAFLNRSFDVESNQAAILSGVAGGNINDPGFSQPPFLRADYTWGGGITLDEIVTRNGFPLTLRSWSIDFDDLRGIGTWELLINLRTQDKGDPISYTLRTALDLGSEIQNESPLGGRSGDIPVGALGSLGSRIAPLHIEATVRAVSAACEADFDGDQDVDGEDLNRLTSGQESISVANFALEFGRTNCL